MVAGLRTWPALSPAPRRARRRWCRCSVRASCWRVQASALRRAFRALGRRRWPSWSLNW